MPDEIIRRETIQMCSCGAVSIGDCTCDDGIPMEASRGRAGSMVVTGPNAAAFQRREARDTDE